MWQHWINGLLGLALLIMGFAGGAITGSTLGIMGLVIAILGFWGAASRHSQAEVRHGQRA